MDDESNLHSVLRRQLRRVGLTAEHPPDDAEAWWNFLLRVNAAYSDADQQQYLHDRAFAVSTREMHQLTEELRLASATQLALERDRLQAVFGSVSTGLVVLDGESRLVELNRAAEELLGVAGEHHTGQSLWTVLVMDETSALELEVACRGNHGWSRADLQLGRRDGSSISSRLNAALDRAERFGVPAAVMFIDLDHFKLVNDTLGHAAGDELLVLAAERLQRVVRRVDALGRFGGDEFVVVMERINDVRAVENLADRITMEMRSPFELAASDAEWTYVSASVGTAISEPGDTASDVLSNADLALYEAKRNGRDRSIGYNEVLRQNVDRRVLMERLLRAACDSGELEVQFQPIWAAADCSVVGFEALVRWELEGQGWVPPSVFVPLAEETGLITRIGNFALAEGVGFARELASAATGERTFVSVNVSALQIDRHDLPDQLALLLGQPDDGQSPISAGAIWLELTESTMLVDPDEASATIDRLTELGVSVMLDGFGAGHGSLAGVRRFRVDGIKVDRSLSHHVRSSAEDRAIIQAVIDLGHALGAQVIAEGVEEDDQRSTLIELGCDALQGPLLSPPLVRADALRLALDGRSRLTGDDMSASWSARR